MKRKLCEWCGDLRKDEPHKATCPRTLHRVLRTLVERQAELEERTEHNRKQIVECIVRLDGAGLLRP